MLRGAKDLDDPSAEVCCSIIEALNKVWEGGSFKLLFCTFGHYRQLGAVV